jgi:hypothetical protein
MVTDTQKLCYDNIEQKITGCFLTITSAFLGNYFFLMKDEKQMKIIFKNTSLVLNTLCYF